jgi:hypothetical protein
VHPAPMVRAALLAFALVLLPAADAAAQELPCTPGSRVPAPEELRPQADLRCVDLRGAALAGVDLAQADLTGAVLAGADLSNARLVQADLIGADLTNADLRGASLVQADLARAVLVGADLAGAELTQADFTGADLTGADVSGTTLDRRTADRPTAPVRPVTDDLDVDVDRYIPFGAAGLFLVLALSSVYAAMSGDRSTMVLKLVTGVLGSALAVAGVYLVLDGALDFSGTQLTIGVVMSFFGLGLRFRNADLAFSWL